MPSLLLKMVKSHDLKGEVNNLNTGKVAVDNRLSSEFPELGFKAKSIMIAFQPLSTLFSQRLEPWPVRRETLIDTSV